MTRLKYDLHKIYFTNRVLDACWQDLDIIYDFRAQ